MHFRPPFRGCFRICGHDKSAPTAACGLPFRCERFVNNATLTHEIGCEHPVRRRGPIHRARILALLNTYIHFTEYVHLHYRTHISATLFVGEYGYVGTINRTFAAANGWQHAASPLLYYNKLSP